MFRASAAGLLALTSSTNPQRTMRPALRPPLPRPMEISRCANLAMTFSRARQLGDVDTNRPWDVPLELANLTVQVMRKAVQSPFPRCHRCFQGGAEHQRTGRWKLGNASENPYVAEGWKWPCNQFEGRHHCLGREVLETSTIARAELKRQLKTLKFTLGCMRG